jgi:hypothetical protein
MGAPSLTRAPGAPREEASIGPVFTCIDRAGHRATLEYTEDREGSVALGRGLSFRDGRHRLALQGAEAMRVAGVRSFPEGLIDPRFSPGSPITIQPAPTPRYPEILGVYSLDGTARAGSVHATRRARVRELAHEGEPHGFVTYEWLGLSGARSGLRILLMSWNPQLEVAAPP